MSREQEFVIPLVAAVAMIVDKHFKLDEKKILIKLITSWLLHSNENNFYKQAILVFSMISYFHLAIPYLKTQALMSCVSYKKDHIVSNMYF